MKLGTGAVVIGEIYNRSLSMEPDAVFEGVARRLNEAVEPPPLRIKVEVDGGTLDQLLGPAFVKGNQFP